MLDILAMLVLDMLVLAILKCAHIALFGLWLWSIVLLINVHTQRFLFCALVVSFIAVDILLALSSVVSVRVCIKGVPPIAGVVTLVTSKSFTGVSSFAMFP